MNGLTLIQTIRERHGKASSAKVGIVSNFDAKAGVTDNGDNNRWITGIATTEDIDLAGEIVVAGGADTTYFFRNRKIFAEHYAGIPATIGRLHSASPIMKGDRQVGWQVRIRMLSNQIADETMLIAREAGIGFSIGFESLDCSRPTDGELRLYSKAGAEPRAIHRRWSWLELSATAFPCNVAAQSMEVIEPSGPEAAKSFDAVERLVRKGLVRQSTAARMGLPIGKRLPPLHKLTIDLGE